MTRFEVEILPEAEAEIREAFLWYFERSPIAADTFRTDTLQAIDRLAVDVLTWPEAEFVLKHEETFLRNRGRVSFGHAWTEDKNEVLEFEVVG